MSDPFRRVVRCDLRAWSSIFGPFKSHFWLLTLECGHQEERRIRWLPDPNAKRQRRGYAAMHRAPSLSRLPPEPQRAKCHQCGRLDGGEDRP